MEEETKEQEATTEPDAEKAHFIAYAPNAKSFAELDAAQEAEEFAEDILDRSKQFRYLAENILYNPEVEDKAAALSALASEFATVVGEDTEQKAVSDEPEVPSYFQQFKDSVMAFLADALGKTKEAEPEPKSGGFCAYKDTETGAWRWLAIFSNKYRDEDHPPEILSEAAHEDFVKAVEDGEWQYPELWLWHVDGTRCGVSDLVTYDDRGFTVASGTFDNDKEAIAKALAKDDDLLVSHGMPSGEIERDAQDETIITRYRTREISVLPATSAANKLTGFVALAQDGGKEMGLPQDKREFLADKMGEEAVVALEAGIGDKAAEAEELNLDHKEAEQVAEDVKAEAEAEQVAEAPQPTVQEIADVISNTITAAIAPVVARLDALEGAAKAADEAEKDRVEELVQMTPAASLKDLVIGSIVGRPEARVDGRSSLAKDKPPETTGTGRGTGIGILDTIREGGDWRAELGAAQPELQ